MCQRIVFHKSENMCCWCNVLFYVMEDRIISLWINEVVVYLVVAVVFTNHTNSRPVRRALTLVGAVFTKHERMSVVLFGLKVVSQNRNYWIALILNTPI